MCKGKRIPMPIKWLCPYFIEDYNMPLPKTLEQWMGALVAAALFYSFLIVLLSL